MMTYGEKIAHLRKAKGITQEELGKVLNVTYQAVSKWERGESLPDFPTMSQIAKYFEVPLDYFEDGGENRQTATPAAPAVQPEPAPAIAGICTVCGKALTEEEIFSSSPMIICKPCADRQKKEAEQRRLAEERAEKARKQAALYRQLGGGVDARLIVGLVLAAISFVILTVLSVKVAKLEEATAESVSGGAYLIAFLPPIVLAVAIVAGDLISEVRDNGDGEGYTLKLSMIVSGAFAAADLIASIILFAVSHEAMVFAAMAAGIVISFTFISQILWGSLLKSIFTCGGFTFKLPGFIFSLTPDSIILMIVTKIFLGVLSVLLFIATTILLGLICVFGSVFTFIPCLLSKIHKDNSARRTAAR